MALRRVTVGFMIYDMPLWRPPSEGRNLILQATLGCSFNGCTFCAMYKTKAFRARSRDEIFADIEDAARQWPDTRRIFLADADALCLPADHLESILDKLAEAFGDLHRISCYATPQNLHAKSEAALARLKDRGLKLVYLGIESGCDDILKRIEKGGLKGLEKALARAEAVGLKVSATVILGLGGKTLWREHIEGTAALINRRPPAYLSTLQLGLEADLRSRFDASFAKRGGRFQEQDDAGVLGELALLLENLDPPRPVIFRSNHASNCLALAGTVPRDTARLRDEVRTAMMGEASLRPKAFRSL